MSAALSERERGVLKEIYAARTARVAAKLREEGIDALILEDSEESRDPSLRYLCGQPSDANLVVSAEGRSLLAAWDINMARELGFADEVLSYSDFPRGRTEALAAELTRLGLASGAKVELPAATSYPAYVDYVSDIPDYDFICRDEGMAAYIVGLRAVKDSGEVALYRRAAALTDEVIDEIEAGVKRGSFATELDVALFIERDARAKGCEGTSFETLAAGPARSFGIHAFPCYGPGPFAGNGFSILDFGLRLDGYCTDVTMSFVRGKLAPKAEKMLELVEKAYRDSLALCGPGRPSRSVALAADAVFSAGGFIMPHALGHGVGLEEHESPAVRSRETNRDILEPGNVITLEPGLYDPELGGLRLENDILITSEGAEQLTHSRIVRL